MFVTKQIWATYHMAHLPVEAKKFGSIDACSAFPFKKLKTWDLKTNWQKKLFSNMQFVRSGKQLLDEVDKVHWRFQILHKVNVW